MKKVKLSTAKLNDVIKFENGDLALVVERWGCNSLMQISYFNDDDEVIESGIMHTSALNVDVEIVGKGREIKEVHWDRLPIKEAANKDFSRRVKNDLSVFTLDCRFPLSCVLPIHHCADSEGRFDTDSSYQVLYDTLDRKVKSVDAYWKVGTYADPSTFFVQVVSKDKIIEQETGFYFMSSPNMFKLLAIIDSDDITTKQFENALKDLALFPIEELYDGTRFPDEWTRLEMLA